MIAFMILVLPAISLPYFFLKGRAERLYLKTVVFGTSALLLGFPLFSFQIMRENVWGGAIAYFCFLTIVPPVNFLLAVGSCIKRRSPKGIRFLLPISISVLLSLGMEKIDLSERLSLLFEFGAYKNELDDYVLNGNKSDRICDFAHYSGIVWTSSGFYSVIVYDKDNNLDALFKQSRSQFNEDFDQSFGNSLDSVLKIQDNYFRCRFHTEDLFK